MFLKYIGVYIILNKKKHSILKIMNIFTPLFFYQTLNIRLFYRMYYLPKKCFNSKFVFNRFKFNSIFVKILAFEQTN